MTTPRSRWLHVNALAVLPILLLLDFGIAYGQQTAKPEGAAPTERPPGQEFALRGQRAARDQVLRLAQVLFQGPWNEHGVPHDSQRHI